jgi:multidrug efflux pump subunit AcrB
MGVPGVANVAIWGMRDQELQVQVDPRRLRDRDVTLDQIVSTTGNAQVVSPLSYLEASTPGTGGFIETPQQRLQVRNVVDKIRRPGGAREGGGRGDRRQAAPR